MVKKIRKIRAKTSDDDGLITEGQEATNCGTCEPLEWTTPPKATRIDPPSNTVAIVVDLVHKQGAIRVFEKKDDTYVNIVGTEEAGNLVIVPWESSWWFRVSGSLRVGYIKVKDAK